MLAQENVNYNGRISGGSVSTTLRDTTPQGLRHDAGGTTWLRECSFQAFPGYPSEFQSRRRGEGGVLKLTEHCDLNEVCAQQKLFNLSLP